MVKPQVLTHVIEGFVFQEANEPFPVTRQRYPPTSETDEDEPAKKKFASSERSSVDFTSPSNGAGAADNEKVACEQCGKMEIKSKMKKKRYCSVICSKNAKLNGLEMKVTNGVSEGKDKCEDVKMDTGTDSVSAAAPAAVTAPVVEEECAIQKWSVQEVCDFIKNLPGCTDYAEDFAIQEIDGQALLLLKENHLVNAMGMKLGPALKIVARVEAMRGPSITNGSAEKAAEGS